MKNLNVFLAQNSDVQLLSNTISGQRKGGRRFVTTDYHAFLDQWSKLNIAGAGHSMCVTMPSVPVGGTYCIEW